MCMKRILLAMLLCLTVVLCAVPFGAAADEVFTVTYELTNVTASGPDTLTNGNELFVTFEADEGYMMPAAIGVTVDGEPFEGARYGVGVTKTTGDLLVMPEDIRGDVVVTVEAMTKYDVHFKGESWSAKVPVPAGLSLNQYYNSPNLVREKEGYVFEGWFEDPEGDTPFDFDAARDTDVTLYPRWTKQYAVTYELVGVTANGPDAVTSGNELFVTFKADEGYMMPAAIGVTVDGEPFEGARYGVGVTKLTGDLLVMPEDIDGDIVVTVEAVKKYDVHFKGESWSAKVPVPAGLSLNQYYNSPNLVREKEGYVFEGWFEDPEGDTPFDFDAARDTDVTLYPRWTPVVENAPTTTTTTTTATTTATTVVTTAPSVPAVTSPQTGAADMTLVLTATLLVSLGGVMLITCLAKKPE